jgi:hypothetical protein
MTDRLRVVLADDEPLGRLALRQLALRHRDLEVRPRGGSNTVTPESE